MVMSPLEAAKLTDDMIDSADRLEQEIDEELKLKFDGVTVVTIRVPSTYGARVVNHVASRYRTAGWSVKYYGLGGADAFLDFTPR